MNVRLESTISTENEELKESEYIKQYSRLQLNCLNECNLTEDTSYSSVCTPTYSLNLEEEEDDNDEENNDEEDNDEDDVKDEDDDNEIKNSDSNSTVNDSDSNYHHIKEYNTRKYYGNTLSENLESQLSNSSLNGDTVKITSASSSELIYTTQMMSANVIESPEVLRNSSTIDYSGDQIPQQKLYENEIDKNEIDKNDLCILSRGTQTLPVLILPLPTEDKITETDFKKGTNDECRHFRTKPTRIKSKSPPILNPNTTQSDGSTLLHQQGKEKEAIMTPTTLNSGVNMDSRKNRQTTSDLDENQMIDGVLWGDVYNDYHEPTSKTTRTSNTQTVINVTKTERDLKTQLISGDQRKIGGTIKKPLLQDLSPIDNGTYQRYFEVQRYDEIVKSYTTNTDRRVRSVCSKMNCKIRLYGPMGSGQLLNYKHSSNLVDGTTKMNSTGSMLYGAMGSRDKVVYTVVVTADSRERLDKSIKCIQETFPKACLTEKNVIYQYTDSLGREIPI